MGNNKMIIEKFYKAFENLDAESMKNCYHKDIQFKDPVFGILNGTEVSDMWEMLIKRSKGDLKIEFSDIITTANTGNAKWIATYHFSKTNREVVNTIKAKFEFKDGLIIKHFDQFSLWNWSIHAIGIKGFLLGWTRFMQHKIKEQAKLSLDTYRFNKKTNSKITI